MKRIFTIAALALSALLLMASAASAAIETDIDPANAPQGTHLQSGTIGCTVDPTTLVVSCSSYELAGVGHTNAEVLLVADYTATVDCNNPGNNRNNPIESHETSFSATRSFPVSSSKNGRMRVGAASVDPAAVAQGCPNPNWRPVIREGTLTLVSFTYTLTFEDFNEPYITITGP